MKRSVIVASLCAVLATLVPVSGFAEPDQASIQAARDLGSRGIELYEEGKYEAAQEMLDRAYRVVPVATLGLWSARAMAKQGKLVEAAERYLEVTRTELPPDATEPLAEAKAQSEKELAEVRARIPKLILSVSGPGAEEATVTIDGTPVPSALLGVPRPANPGEHRVEAVQGSQKVSKTITLAEGASETLELDLTPPEAPPAPVAEPKTLPRAPTPSAPEQDSASPGGGQRTAGFVVLGIGAVGVVAGGVLGSMAMGQKSDLEATCGSLDHCPASSKSDVDSYNQLRTLSTIGFAAGGVGLAAGALLLLTAPSQQAGAAIHPWVGLGQAGVGGRF